jgi:hypothetical protein
MMRCFAVPKRTNFLLQGVAQENTSDLTALDPRVDRAEDALMPLVDARTVGSDSGGSDGEQSVLLSDCPLRG